MLLIRPFPSRGECPHIVLKNSITSSAIDRLLKTVTSDPSARNAESGGALNTFANSGP